MAGGTPTGGHEGWYSFTGSFVALASPRGVVEFAEALTGRVTGDD